MGIDGEDKSLLLAFIERLTRIETMVGQLVEQNKTRGEDHERRLRALEKWKYGIPVAVLGAVAAIIERWR